MAKKRGAYKKAQKGKPSPREVKLAKWIEVVCPTCKGSGKRGIRKCGLCKGKGTIKVLEK